MPPVTFTFPRTKWRAETAKYESRVTALTLVTPELQAQLERWPGGLRGCPSDSVALNYRTLIFVNHSMASASELLLSVQVLWREGHHLAAGHCIRLLFEVWGSLLYAQASVLKKATESSEAAATADARLQRLLLGTNSRPLLPAGIKDEIRVIRVGKFIEAGEAAVVGFRTKYDFLCDISHPTYMHSNFHWLTYDLSWTNDLHVREVHRILDEVTHAAEMAVTGISAAIVEMYRTCMPDIDNYVASTKSSDVET